MMHLKSATVQKECVCGNNNNLDRNIKMNNGPGVAQFVKYKSPGAKLQNCHLHIYLKENLSEDESRYDNGKLRVLFKKGAYVDIFACCC